MSVNNSKILLSNIKIFTDRMSANNSKKLSLLELFTDMKQFAIFLCQLLTGILLLNFF